MELEKTAALSPLAQAWSELRGYSMFVFLMCLLGWSLASMDQSLFGYAIPGIKEEFGSSVTDIGWVLFASFVFAGFASSVIGMLGDRYGRRTMFISCLAISAFLVGLHAFVTGLVTLTILRMLAFGISNGLSPITNAFTAEAAPARFRGLLVGLLQCGYPLGWFVASLIAVPIMAEFGWRYIFMPALLVIPIAFWLARRLPESRRFTEMREKLDAEPVKNPPLHKLRQLFAPDLRRKTILTFIAFFMFGGAYAGTAFYFVLYFTEARGYSAEVATSIVGTSYGIGVLGYIAVAFLGEFVMTRRNLCVTWAWLGAASLAGLVWLPDSRAEDVLWFGLMAAFFYGNGAALSMMVAETFPTRVRATAGGFAASFALNMGHAVFPLLVAYGVEQVGWQWAFTIAVVPTMFICGLAMLGLKNTRSGLDLDEIAT